MNKVINAYDDELLSDVGIKNMTMVRIHRLDEPKLDIRQASPINGYIPLTTKQGIMVQRQMPGDNSCLFHTLEYIFNNKSRADPYYIRQEVSEIVTLHPTKFTSDFLGLPNPVYAQTILRPETWGSNVEIFIYSFVKECQIIVLDFKNKLDVTYGEKSLNRCCFIIFSKDHFNVLSFAPTLNSDEREDTVLFNNTDKLILSKVKQYCERECPGFTFSYK